MAKKTNKEKVAPARDPEFIFWGDVKVPRTVDITAGAIVDGFCNYSYENTAGVLKGGQETMKGPGIVDDDMLNAFAKFRVHMAVIDSAFKHSGIQIGNIDDMHTDEITQDYEVTAFKIFGSKGNESVQMFGNKHASEAGGRMEVKTLKIPLDNMSSYKWFKELKAVTDDARDEVALYHGGKFTAVKHEEEDTDAEQGSLYENAGEGGDDMTDFDNAKA